MNSPFYLTESIESIEEAFFFPFLPGPFTVSLPAFSSYTNDKRVFSFPLFSNASGELRSHIPIDHLRPSGESRTPLFLFISRRANPPLIHGLLSPIGAFLSTR